MDAHKDVWNCGSVSIRSRDGCRVGSRLKCQRRRFGQRSDSLSARNTVDNQSRIDCAWQVVDDMTWWWNTPRMTEQRRIQPFHRASVGNLGQLTC